MERIKKLLRPIYIPIVNYRNLRFFKSLELKSNFRKDHKLYKKYATAFSKKDLKNKEADLILNYHSLEKGMLFQNMKPKFAEYRIRNLHQILKDPEIQTKIHRSQIRVGYEVMCKYYELHQEQNYNIEDIYPAEKYHFYKKVLGDFYRKEFSGIYKFSKEEFYKDVNAEFEKFAHSRKSIRDFTKEKVELSLIEKSIELANTAPSVCNRQASNVYLVEDKILIDKILSIQGGFQGYSENVTQLLILTNDRKYYYTVGERNQLYIDGGLYLMNLLYALHYYQIANCPANWGKNIREEDRLKKVITLPESEKIICLIPIGVASENFRTTLSERRPILENFKTI